MTIILNANGGRKQQLHDSFFFYGLPFADIDESQNNRGGEGVIFIFVHHVHLLKNIPWFQHGIHVVYL